MKIIKIKEEMQKPLQGILKSQRQVRHGILLLTRESEYLHKELWKTLKAEYPEIGEKFAHFDSKDWEITLFNRKGMKTTTDHMVEAQVSEAKDIAEDLEARIDRLEICMAGKDADNVLTKHMKNIEDSGT